MSNKNDGGPAFPVRVPVTSMSEKTHHTGMSLRAYFAAKAQAADMTAAAIITALVTGLAAALKDTPGVDTKAIEALRGLGAKFTPKLIAEEAVSHADALLKELEKGK